MPHSFSYAVSMNLEHSIKERSHERYPDHLQCFRNIKKKIKYPDFQAMTLLCPKCIGNNVVNSSSAEELSSVSCCTVLDVLVCTSNWGT